MTNPHQAAQLFNILALLWLRPETEGAPEGLERVLQASGLTIPEEEVTKEALEREYARLFLGVGPATVPLCESAWTSPLRLLCQEAQFECAKAYREAGLEVPSDAGVPDDHLGMTMAFLALLLEKNETGAAAAFAKAHPMKWIHAVETALLERDDAILYRLVLEATKAQLARFEAA